MTTLQVLGRFEVLGADGGPLHSILAQPKRQAVLAYLAVAVPRGYHRRDSIVGLLWPDSGEEHARASLSRAVNHLRQTLGADTILSRGHAELGIDWQRLWCDARGFEEALDAGKPAEAMALYQGDLLPGFYVDEAPAFEQWLERERARLRGRAVQASRLLSEKAETAGDLAEAIEWARRAASLEPFDESVVRRVMILLEKSADRAGALRTYDEFAARLKTELDTEPAAETSAVMRTIRDRELAAPSVSVPHAVPRVRDAVPAAAAAGGTLPPARGERWTPRRSAVIGIAALVTVAAAGLMARVREPAAAAEGGATVAVLPFVVQAGSPDPLSEEIVTLLSERLNHSGVLRAVDSRAMRSIGRPLPPIRRGADSALLLAARFNPRFVLLGEITPTADSVRIDAALYDSTAQRPVASASARGRRDDIARLAADVSQQVVAARPTRREPIWERGQAVLTPSVPALRAFLAGEEAYGHGRFADAARSYKAAVDADTTFALAYHYLGRAANWAGDLTMETFANRKTMDNIDRLSVADQWLARGWNDYLGGRVAEAERNARLIVVNEPGMMDGWYLLGEVQFHWGSGLGWTRQEARESYERAAAVSATAGTLVHLARLAAMEGRAAAVDSFVGAAILLGVDEPQALELRALRAHAMGNRAEAERVHAAIRRLGDDAAFSVVSPVVAHTAQYPLARGAADVLRQPRRGASTRVIGTILAAQIEVAQGNEAGALRLLSVGSDLTPARAAEYRGALAVAPFRHDVTRERLEDLRAAVLAIPEDDLGGRYAHHFTTNRIYKSRQTYLLGMLSLRTGNLAEAERMAAKAKANEAVDTDYRDAGEILRAEILRAAGKNAEALAALGSPEEQNILPGVMEYIGAHERFLRAELLRSLGRYDEALRWFGTFPDPGANDLFYLPAVRAAIAATVREKENRAKP